MDCISKSPIRCSKVLLNYALNCTNFPGERGDGYMFRTNCPSLGQKYKNLVFFKQKRGKKSPRSQILDNELLSSSKPLKIGPKYRVFPIKNEDICD